MAVGDEAVHDLVTLAHPACDRATCTKVNIVGVRGDYEDLHWVETTQ